MSPCHLRFQAEYIRGFDEIVGFGCFERVIKMKIAFAFLSICGLLFPVLCFSLHFSQRGEAAWHEFFAAPFATWVISGFTWDLLITAAACTIWMSSESRRLKMPGFHWHFLAIFLVGICFALPTFLFRREGYLANSRNKQQEDKGSQ